MNIRFTCPICEYPGRVDGPGGTSWQCPGCDHTLAIPPIPIDQHLETCAVCGNHELYKKKDFPHWLGLTILTAACLAFMTAQAFYWPWVAWAILLGSALFDGILYLTVRDAIVCYRCDAHYRGMSAGTDHAPFELGVAERYRQERLRREQLQAEKK